MNSKKTLSEKWRNRTGYNNKSALKALLSYPAIPTDNKTV
jgi:hypothetical protein